MYSFSVGRTLVVHRHPILYNMYSLSLCHETDKFSTCCPYNISYLNASYHSAWAPTDLASLPIYKQCIINRMCSLSVPYQTTNVPDHHFLIYDTWWLIWYRLILLQIINKHHLVPPTLLPTNSPILLAPHFCLQIHTSYWLDAMIARTHQLYNILIITKLHGLHIKTVIYHCHKIEANQTQQQL